jgi:hypothetical protein
MPVAFIVWGSLFPLATFRLREGGVPFRRDARLHGDAGAIVISTRLEQSAPP